MNNALCRSCGEARDEEDESWIMPFVERVHGGWMEDAVHLALVVS